MAFTVLIDYGKCIACGACVENCASGALQMVDGVTKWVPDACEDCGVCAMVCPEEAIALIEKTA